MSHAHRLRALLGFGAALMLLASSAAHGVGGWDFMRKQLQALNAPADLQLGLQFGWMLGSLAMLVFGLVAALLCLQRWRGRPASAAVLWLLALGYGGYGAWVYTASAFNPQFLVFLLPAALLAIAAPEGRPA